MRSSTNSAVSDAWRFATSSSPYRRILSASRYQSQTSFQTKPYSSLTRFEKSNDSNCAVAVRVTSFSRVRIQRSIGSAPVGAATASGSAPSSTSRERSRACS